MPARESMLLNHAVPDDRRSRLESDGRCGEGRAVVAPFWLVRAGDGGVERAASVTYVVDLASVGEFVPGIGAIRNVRAGYLDGCYEIPAARRSYGCSGRDSA